MKLVATHKTTDRPFGLVMHQGHPRFLPPPHFGVYRGTKETVENIANAVTTGKTPAVVNGEPMNPEEYRFEVV